MAQLSLSVRLLIRAPSSMPVGQEGSAYPSPSGAWPGRGYICT